MARITTTGKVAIGFLLMAAVLSISIVFTFRAMKNMTTAVSVVGEPSKKTQAWMTAARKLGKASGYVQQWNIDHADEELVLVDSCRIVSDQQIEKLYDLCIYSREQTILVDSLKLIAELWFENLGSRIVAADTSAEKQIVIDQILQQLARHETLIPVSALENSEKKDSVKLAEETKKREKLWRRIFHKESREEIKPVVVTDTVKKDTAKKSIVETSRIRTAIQQGQKQEKSISEIRLLEEMAFLNNENAIRDRLRSNGDNFEKIVAKETEAKLTAVSNTSERSSRVVATWVSVTALFFMCIFIFMVRSDVVRGRKINNQLDVLRRNAEGLAKAKEEFVANMSHEIRTPLNIISGFSAQLLKSGLDKKRHIQAEGIQRSSAHLLAVVNDILDYSKIESGKLEIEQVGFRPLTLGDDLRIAFEDIAQQKKLEFDILVSPDVPEIILGDPVRIRQVLYNLVSNALKFTHQGNVSVTIDAESSLADIPLLVIRVADTGIGIPEEKIETIFEAFVQADSSITRRYGGTGLGLAISKYLVEEMDGTIIVDSKPGSGTIFTMAIQLIEAKEAELAERVRIKPMQVTLQDKMVLICDDEPLNRVLASHILEAQGASILEAGTGQEAMRMLEHQPVDLILMDLQMPEMSGEDVVKKIRSSPSPQIASIPIIAITGRSSRDEKEKCLSIGMNGYLAKPYKEADLLHIIQDVFAGR